jgi:hypothetical protein
VYVRRGYSSTPLSPLYPDPYEVLRYRHKTMDMAAGSRVERSPSTGSTTTKEEKCGMLNHQLVVVLQSQHQALPSTVQPLSDQSS